jgi:hypothetical protein
MIPSGPLHVTTRAELRAYLTTLAGRRHGWGHLAIRHNTVQRAAPCRFCEGTATPAEGPAVFWDGDPVCAECAAEIAPELATYARTLQRIISRLGGDWRAL